MNNRFAFAAGLAVSALAFGCVAAVAAPTEEAPAPENVIDVPAVELEATVTPAPVVVEEAAPVAEEEAPAPVVTTDPLPLEEAITLEEAPAEEAPAPLSYEETVARFGEDFAVGDVIVCPEGWTVATDTTAEGFHWAACM